MGGARKRAIRGLPQAAIIRTPRRRRSGQRRESSRQAVIRPHRRVVGVGPPSPVPARNLANALLTYRDRRAALAERPPGRRYRAPDCLLVQALSRPLST